MKIKFSVLLLLLLFCLSSCSEKGRLVMDGPPYGILISAEIRTKRVKKDEPFEIQVGLGRLYSYQIATLLITGTNLEITAPDGSEVKASYVCEYPDFEDEKYGTHWDGEKDRAGYFETFRFRYIGEDEPYTGSISFAISGVDEIYQAGGMTGSSAVRIYYKVRGNRITLTTKRLETDS